MKLGYFFLALALVVVAVIAMAGFRGHHFGQPPFEVFPDMNYQAKVKDQQPSAFFADGMASRQPVEGTVAEEMPAQDDYWATGKWDASHWGDGIPVHAARDGGRALEISAADLARGRERYSINCAMCHGATGAGNGITSQYGLSGAANYHTDRLRTDSDGDLFNTITNGKGQMMGYGYNIDIDDRWRIVMYIRALQHSENAKLPDASAQEQQDLQSKGKAASGTLPSNSTMNEGVSGSPTSYNFPGRWIDDYGTEIGNTYYYSFSSSSSASHRFEKTPLKLRPFTITYVSQRTVAKGPDGTGWVDLNLFQ